MTVLDDYRPRLEHAADQVESAEKQYRLALAKRHALVVDAVDAGITGKLVAAWSKISQPHVVRLCGKPVDDDALTA